MAYSGGVSLPSSISVGGKRVKVVWVKELEDGNWADWNRDKYTVTLAHKCKEEPDGGELCLMHELIHASFDIGGDQLDAF